MSKYKTIGVVNPGIKLEAVFYEEGKLQRDPVVALLVVEYTDDEGMESVVTEPLSFNEKIGDIFEVMILGSYLGLEAEGKKKDWKKDIKEMDKFETTQKKRRKKD